MTNIIGVTKLIFDSLINSDITLLRRKVMVEVTSTATTQIAKYFEDREIAPVRIFLNDGG